MQEQFSELAGRTLALPEHVYWEQPRFARSRPCSTRSAVDDLRTLGLDELDSVIAAGAANQKDFMRASWPLSSSQKVHRPTSIECPIILRLASPVTAHALLATYLTEICL